MDISHFNIYNDNVGDGGDDYDYYYFVIAVNINITNSFIFIVVAIILPSSQIYYIPSSTESEMLQGKKCTQKVGTMIVFRCLLRLLRVHYLLEIP